MREYSLHFLFWKNVFDLGKNHYDTIPILGVPTGEISGRSTPPIWAATGLAVSKAVSTGTANPRTVR